MITVYVQDKPLYLLDQMDKQMEKIKDQPKTIVTDDSTPSAIREMMESLEQPQFNVGILKGESDIELLARLKEQVNVIVAAGGLVHTRQNEVLLIHRLGKWDLPKGKLDEGENLEECALREIREETGADNLAIEKFLKTTYHTYHQNGKLNLKESHWYLVNAAEKSRLTPQTEENVTECVWVPADKIGNYIDGAFASVAEVLKEGVAMLQLQSK